jgi:hypothetical protein
MKAFLPIITVLTFLSASAQDNKEFTWYMYPDSLTDASLKDPNGRIFKNGELELKKEGKLYLYVVSEEFNVYVLIKTPSGKWITKEGVTKDKQFYKNSKFSFAELDTMLDEDGKYIFYFSTMTPGSKGKFNAEIVFAPKESLYADKNEKDFCKQISFLYKHAALGFHFLRNSTTRYKDDKASLYDLYYFPLIPAEWFNDFDQRIERTSMLDYYRYHAKIFYGSYAESKTKYDELKDQLKKCLGNEYTFEEKTTEAGNILFQATIKDPDRFIIKTWAAWRKDVKYRFELSLYRYADAPNAARILLDVANLYEPME